MFPQQRNRERIPGTKPKWRIHGAVVAASWGTTVVWVAVEILVPPHRLEAALWRASTALAFTAVSSCLLVIWCIVRALVEPINDQQYAARMGYRAGYNDGEAARMARMYALPSARTEHHSSSG